MCDKVISRIPKAPIHAFQCPKVTFQAPFCFARSNGRVVLHDPVHEGRLVYERLENGVLVAKIKTVIDASTPAVWSVRIHHECHVHLSRLYRQSVVHCVAAENIQSDLSEAEEPFGLVAEHHRHCCV